MKPGPTLMSFERSLRQILLRYMNCREEQRTHSYVWMEGDESRQWRHRDNVEAPRGLQYLLDQLTLSWARAFRISSLKHSNFPSFCQFITVII